MKNIAVTEYGNGDDLSGTVSEEVILASLESPQGVVEAYLEGGTWLLCARGDVGRSVFVDTDGVIEFAERAAAEYPSDAALIAAARAVGTDAASEENARALAREYRRVSRSR